MGSSATTYGSCSITICERAGQITLKSELLHRLLSNLKGGVFSVNVKRDLKQGLSILHPGQLREPPPRRRWSSVEGRLLVPVHGVLEAGRANSLPDQDA